MNPGFASILRGSGRRANLVEERERSGFAFERPAHELAQRRLGLGLDRRGQTERGDRLDVETLVGLEQLEGIQRQARALVRRTRTTLAQDAAKGWDPAEALVGLEHPIALDAPIDLGTLAQLIEQVHLEPARDAARIHLGVEQLVR